VYPSGALPVASVGFSARLGDSVLSTIPTAQAINLFSSQILLVENVELWLKKVERISRIHNVSDNVILLAASNKLMKLACGSIWIRYDQRLVDDF